jgi:hypothetical protein
MTDPTPQDIANARRRAEIAARFQAEYALAEALAVSAFGAGWKPVCYHSLVDHDEADAPRRESRRLRPAAVVYTAEKDGERRHFVVVDGQAKEVAGYQQGFGGMLTEPHPTRTFTVKGQTHHVHRYGLYWAGYEPDYRPRSAEQLAAARRRREQKAVEKEAEERPLFADVIRPEGFDPRGPKGRG